MTTFFGKDVDTARVPASMTKVMTACLARAWVPDGDLDTPVTIISADGATGPGTNLLATGDIVKVRDLFYLMMCPSRDEAAHALARHVGGLMVAAGGTGSSDPHTRFIEQMNAQALVWGASTAIFYDAGGASDNNRLSPRHVALLTRRLAADAFLLTVAGTLTRSITTLNGSPRTFACNNIFDPAGTTQPDPRVVTGYAFPEHLGSKYGITTAAGYCLTFVWTSTETGTRVSVVMGCGNDTELKRDLRTMINYEKRRAIS